MLAPVAEDLARVDALIGARLDSDVALVREVARYIVASGGKRLRPALLLLSCRALGYGGEARFQLAAVVEFIHTATLCTTTWSTSRACAAGAAPRTPPSATPRRCWSATSSIRALSR
jgi:hypothetical protein